jgi:AcrR family transcriptional regulator
MSGLRERKKRQTREAIAQAAADLFARKGFAAVTVDDVAQAADVSRQTVFNYFPSKEQMLFDRDADVEAVLVEAVRDRGPDVSLIAVFRAHTRAHWMRMGSLLDVGPLPHGFWEIVRGSQALRDYAEAMFARHARSVARELAAERGLAESDAFCSATARALCGVNSAVLVYGLERLTAGEEPRGVVADALGQADRAYDLLEDGFGRLADTRPAGPAGPAVGR